MKGGKGKGSGEGREVKEMTIHGSVKACKPIQSNVQD